MIKPLYLICIICSLWLLTTVEKTIANTKLLIPYNTQSKIISIPIPGERALRFQELLIEKDKTIKRHLQSVNLKLITSSRKHTQNLWLDEELLETRKSCLRSPTSSCVIEQAHAEAKATTDIWRRDFSLIFVTEAQVKFGDITAATETTEAIKNASLRLPALLIIAKAHALVGNFQEANKITNEVANNIEKIRMPYIRTWVFALSASALTATKNFKHARMNILEALQTVGQIKESSTRAEMHALIASAQAGVSNLSGANENINRAFTEVDKTEDPFLSALALTFIASTQSEVGQNKNYKRTISTALTKALTLRTRPRALVLAFISSIQAQTGDISAAKETIESAIVAVNMIPDAHSLAPALAFIGKTLAQIDSPTHLRPSR